MNELDMSEILSRVNATLASLDKGANPFDQHLSQTIHTLSSRREKKGKKRHIG